MTPYAALAAIAAVFAVLFVFGLVQKPPSPESSLRDEALQLLRWGSADGAARLAERIGELRLKFPGKTDAWLLQWLVEDLKRAKR